MKEIRICDNASVDKVLNLCEENELGIEIQGFYNPNMIRQNDNFLAAETDNLLSDETENLIDEYTKKFASFKAGKSLHAPFWDLNLGSKNPMIRQATMKTFNYAYMIAKRLGCTEIVVHNGFVPNTSYYEGWVKNATAFWQEFFSDKDDSITMMIENQCEEDSEVIKMEIDSVNDKRLKVCLDIGHANSNSNMSVENWIESLGDRIGYLHLHNNHGKIEGRPSYLNDEHFGLDNGTIDIEKALSLLETHCPNAIWNIECKLDYMEKSIEILKDLGYINN